MEASTPNPLERRLDLSVAIADVEKEMDKQLKRLGQKTKMPGFRPGKIPMNILKKQYGEQAYQDALNEVLNRVFQDAVAAGNHRIAGKPTIDPKNSDSTTHIEVTATFEVYPEITLGDLSSAEIVRPVLEIGEAEIDRTIEILRQKSVRYETADRAAAREDRVVIDFSGKVNGEPFEGGSANDYPLVLGEGTLLDDFEKAIEGMRAGESKTFDIVFPENYFLKDVAGKAATFEVKVKQVMAPILPEIDAEFAKRLGIKDGDITKMRSEIANNLKREVKRRIESEVKKQAMEALLQATPITAPKALTEMEIQRMQQNLIKELERSGMNAKDFPMQRELFAEQAARRVSLGLIVAHAIKAEGLEAKSQQVRAFVEEVAESYEKPDELVRWYYGQPQRLAEAEDLMSENNVVSWVLSKAKVTEKAADFEELMGRKPI